MADLNVFGQAPAAGFQDLQIRGNVISAVVDTAVVSTIVAGQPVRWTDAIGGTPKVVPMTANTQLAQGIALFNVKNSEYKAGQPLEIGLAGTVVYLTAGGAIARGAKVEVVYTTNKVITSGGSNPTIGYAYDKAVADGDLIRVYLESTGKAVV